MIFVVDLIVDVEVGGAPAGLVRGGIVDVGKVALQPLQK